MSRKGLLLFLIAGVAWGMPYFFIKVAVADFSGEFIILARVVIGAAVLVPLAIRAKALVPALKAWKAVLAFALFEMVGPWWLITHAENGHIDSGLAGLLIATVPFMALAVTYYYLGDRSVAHPKNLLGLVIGFVGIIALVGIDALTHDLELVWVGAVLLAAVGYAIAPAIASKNAPQVDTVGIIALSMVFTAVIYVVPALMNPLAEGVTTPKIESWMSLLVLGVVCSAVAFVVFFDLMREIGLSRASLITYVNTGVAFALGIFFAGETATLGMLVGFPLVVIGSYFASRNHSKV
jgi:drug/metabolite transporter (DMT)-like permease